MESLSVFNPPNLLVTLDPKVQKIEEETTTKVDEKKDFISIKKEEDKPSHDDNVYFIADILPDKKNNMKLSKTIKIDTKKSMVSEAKKETAEAMVIKSEKIPFMMVPTNNNNKRSAKDRIKNAVIDTSIILSSLPTKKENADEEEQKEIVKDGTPIKSLYKSEEEEISPEEAKIADIAVDREILEDIKEDIKKQQHILNPFMAEAKKTVDEKEIETKEKIENIKNMEKYRENTLEIKQDILDEKKEILENLEKEKKDIANKIDQLTEEII